MYARTCKTKFNETILSVFDGERWYPIKLRSPTRNQQRNKTIGESTEPMFMCLKSHTNIDLSNVQIILIYYEYLTT